MSETTKLITADEASEALKKEKRHQNIKALKKVALIAGVTVAFHAAAHFAAKKLSENAEDN